MGPHYEGPPRFVCPEKNFVIKNICIIKKYLQYRITGGLATPGRESLSCRVPGTEKRGGAAASVVLFERVNV